jgi:hypothetical protein
MTLALFVIALLAAVGLSHIIVDGSIFAKWRGSLVEKYKETKPWVVELISCYQCTGFWAGAFMGLFLQPFYWYFHLSFYLWKWLAVILSLPAFLLLTPFIVGCAASYASMAAAALLNWLDAPAMAIATKKNDNEPNKT